MKADGDDEEGEGGGQTEMPMRRERGGGQMEMTMRRERGEDTITWAPEANDSNALPRPVGPAPTTNTVGSLFDTLDRYRLFNPMELHT